MNGGQDDDGAPEGIDWNGPDGIRSTGPLNLENFEDSKCSNDSTDGSFDSHDDWAAIDLGLRWGRGRGEPDSDEEPVEEVSDPELTDEEAARLTRVFHSTDLAAL